MERVVNKLWGGRGSESECIFFETPHTHTYSIEKGKTAFNIIVRHDGYDVEDAKRSPPTISAR
jgi:hypothetical protein